ncbi:hypothetical protein N7495_007954 [Penicillium taxi]|uniref:uncharacterized protein n=1 Tax=Penicillium taxi TaxID=168475 RepID=UPI002545542E|nr:uncharacterized protein N7495_007954 [Penicillium taxi]KAJ5887913.1 hypothetical protein N7495_007954 [Penicillium taxi]
MEPFPATDSPGHTKTQETRTTDLPLYQARSREIQQNLAKVRRANTVAQGGDISRILELKELKARRGRTNSTGIRAKDNQEPLRKHSLQSLQRSHTHRAQPTAGPAGRKAGHFTVGSVGQNGKIFLRPIANPSQTDISIVPYSSIDQVTTNSLQPQSQPRTFAHVRRDHARWSNSQLSESYPEEVPVEDNESVFSSKAANPGSTLFSRKRATSFSTIPEKQSVRGAGKRGELRIVIDRSEDRPRTTYEKSRAQTLKVPIPHYRLGSPRFSAEGSAMMQSSAYTQTPMSDSFGNSTLFGGMADPLPTLLRSPYGRDSFSYNRASFTLSIFSGTAAIDLSRSTPVPRNSMVYELNGPVEPSIYETLVSDMDDEAVVRYFPGTKDVSAATPARIVAQISSESFMDYELVSDFFLTFRSYLSPSHLLALLLARLQWAIHRLQDDGRIIRIRTFAALRHWILNYFVDDFVAISDLRTHFCETINTLYLDVKSRRNGGTSDLKILIDLKRCWNGKCQVYWGGSDFSRALIDPDSPIVPGSGQIDPLDGDAAPQSVSHPSLAQSLVASRHNNFRQSLATPQHDRNNSAATQQSIPFSAKSEQSMLALSCSLPPKLPHPSHPRSTAPRPVPVGLVNPGSSHDHPVSSPMLSRHPFRNHVHKRSGSFSDSARDDRMPIFGMEIGSNGSAPKEISDPVGFIRGVLYPPAESYMTMMAPESPPLPVPSASSSLDRRSMLDGGPKNAQPTSGVRTIIGSIRRVLHTRNGGHSFSGRLASASEFLTTPSRGRTSHMPNHIALGSEYYRERKMAAAPKHPMRVDVLCEHVLKEYIESMGHNDAKNIQPISVAPELQITAQSPSDNTESFSSLKAPEVPETGDLKSDLKGDLKTSSELTTETDSLVMINESALEIPAMSGAVRDAKYDPSLPLQSYNASSSRLSCTASLRDEPENSLSYRKSFTSETPSITRKKMSFSLRLRKYASFQSISRHRIPTGSDKLKAASSQNDMRDQEKMPSNPVLRRRPGGNLRRVQHAGDLEQLPGRESVLSTYSSNDSVAEAPKAEQDPSRPPTALIFPSPNRFSLVHASPARRIRRSFEAALARFAQIPDDDDGGIESTLLKLEGKWPSSPPADQEAGFEKVKYSDPEDKKDKAVSDGLLRRRQTDKSTYSTVGGRLAPPRPYSDSVAESEESYNSVPLLERGLADDSVRRPLAPTFENHTPLSLISSRDSELVSSHPSIQIIHETESIQRIPPGSTAPDSSFLNVAPITPKHLSLPSSVMSMDIIGSHEAVEGHTLNRHSFTSSAVDIDIPPHPLGQPPSPPMTIQHPPSFGSDSLPANKAFFQAQPLTPDTSPLRPEVDRFHQARHVPQLSRDILSNSEKDHKSQGLLHHNGPDHVPFILACESQILAQQLTLVEMAALSEVDWRDLVEMKWNSSSHNVVSWVQFLSEKRKGIDLVVGRFNLMVKWVVSEIVLTSDIHERAHTVIKYIHTAAHARRICNYATMLQIAIALSSSDCSRLQKTWDLVPLEDKRMLKDMECLIQPVRNFYELRYEMETANLQEGCIPFIGLYVHDLTYNSQKPAQIANADGGMLVNFERYRTSARIVKGLLRLIDASTKYRFEPVPGIIERCLWIASLPEDEIQVLSKKLEA